MQRTKDEAIIIISFSVSISPSPIGSLSVPCTHRKLYLFTLAREKKQQRHKETHCPYEFITLDAADAADAAIAYTMFWVVVPFCMCA